MPALHTHKDEHGKLVKCYHDTKAMLLTHQFWISTIIAFPLEHWLWEKVFPFNWLTNWMGL